MEKWVRSLSKTNALIFGFAGIAAVIIFYCLLGNSFYGLLPMLLLCAIVGAGVGFSTVLLFKGITGQTPQERKEMKNKSM